MFIEFAIGMRPRYHNDDLSKRTREPASTKTATERVSISHIILYTVTFCSCSSRCHNTSEPLWWSDRVKVKCVYCNEYRRTPSDRRVRLGRTSQRAS